MAQDVGPGAADVAPTGSKGLKANAIGFWDDQWRRSKKF